ncbi:ABC transporter ATP-binding protein [Robiginitalea sp. IMCC44478]|uniref:ABC transporter ATP-binding protein n=1 Tax=Robiginitalea sp. IMCC44478 TaxID=3459122 RepID=UPI004042F42D
MEHIAKAFGRKKVLSDVSFQLDAGSLTGIVGENGSGKTILLKIIVGILKAQRGIIHLEGTFGYCPQIPLLYPQLTVNEHFKYFSAAYGLGKERGEGQAAALLEHFNFTKYQEERVNRLSGGTQQKLNLSLALLHSPDLLILDEPYNGFDWDTYQRFWTYTDELKDRGCAILVVTHLLSEKGRFDRIYELENGVLV